MNRIVPACDTYCRAATAAEIIGSADPRQETRMGTLQGAATGVVASVDSTATPLDATLTLALAQASLAAYLDYQQQSFAPPPNYQFFGRFTGWDEWFGPIGREERFGVIFKYVGPEAVTDRFIVAFRGTSSDSDMLEDAFFEWSTFKPYRGTIAPVPDDVSAGFNGIYSRSGGSMSASMQKQLFAVLPAQPSEIFITGHSLGGALSQLFTLDMRVSSPGVQIETLNFASARVGGRHWQAACDASGATQKIMRVINYYDYVPDVPLSFELSDKYVSIGAQFLTAFHGKDWGIFDELHRHSLANLTTVLTHCLILDPQVWTGTFWDATQHTYQMQSVAPPQQSREGLVAKLRELRASEIAARQGPAISSH
jgi:triacylglycerol lipase